MFPLAECRGVGTAVTMPMALHSVGPQLLGEGLEQ